MKANKAKAIFFSFWRDMKTKIIGVTLFFGLNLGIAGISCFLLNSGISFLAAYAAAMLSGLFWIIAGFYTGKEEKSNA